MDLPSGEIVPILGFSGLVGSGTVMILPTIVPSTAPAGSRPVTVTMSSPAALVPCVITHSSPDSSSHGVRPSPPVPSSDHSPAVGTRVTAPLSHV